MAMENVGYLIVSPAALRKIADSMDILNVSKMRLKVYRDGDPEHRCLVPLKLALADDSGWIDLTLD